MFLFTKGVKLSTKHSLLKISSDYKENNPYNASRHLLQQRIPDKQHNNSLLVVI